MFKLTVVTGAVIHCIYNGVIGKTDPWTPQQTLIRKYMLTKISFGQECFSRNLEHHIEKVF